MTEVKIHLFACSVIVLCMEVFLLMHREMTDFSREVFIPTAMAFFFLLCVLEYLFRLFVGRTAALFLSMIPAALLFLLLRKSETWPYLEAAVAAAAVVRTVCVFMPRREEVLLCGCFLLDAAALYLFLFQDILTGTWFTDRILFICLTVLTLAAMQKLLHERKRTAFPFYYFMLIGLILINMPMSRDPIDWTPAVRAGERLVGTLMNAANDVTYYLSSFLPDTNYTAGYSSLNIKGGRTGETERTQIILRMEDRPYFVYQDEETGKSMKVRRILRLAGGLGTDREQLVRFLRFLYEKGVDRENASLFSKVSYVDVEYAYIDTNDEIAPSASILLTSGTKKVENGISDTIHRKGYEIKACYIEIDYGSPYLIGLLRRNEEGPYHEPLTYEEASDYMRRVYGVGFRRFMSEEEYSEIYEGAFSGQCVRGCTSTNGTSGRMAELAHDITDGAENEYDKCRLIEEYLRQYRYSSDAVGGHNSDSDMSTSEGMADIADRFLFETQAGYCVHYTASMVMLLRLSGIPARAVSGFRYEFPFEAEEAYSVSSNCAHMWPEAYLENAGWVPFEPTGAFRTAAEYTWHRKAETKEVNGDEAQESNVPELPETTESEDTTDFEEEGLEDTAGQIFRVTWPVVFSILALLAIMIAGTSMIRNLRYRYATPEQRLNMDVEMIKRSIRKQSPESFADRGLLSDYVERAPEELRGDVQTVFAIYYRSIYGNGDTEISQEENELAKGLREKLSNKRTSVI